MTLLDLEVMVVDLQAETDLLDLGSVLITAGLTGLDLLVVLELAVIDELGDRRLCVGCHLDEIEVRFLGQVQCDGGRDDPHLLAVRADQAHLGDANLVVNAWFVADDDSNPRCFLAGSPLGAHVAGSGHVIIHPLKRILYMAAHMDTASGR